MVTLKTELVALFCFEFFQCRVFIIRKVFIMKFKKKFVSFLVASVVSTSAFSFSSNAMNAVSENNGQTETFSSSANDNNGYLTVTAYNSYYPANNKVIVYSALQNHTSTKNKAKAIVKLHKGKNASGTTLRTGNAEFTLSANGGSNSASCFYYISSGWITVEAYGEMYIRNGSYVTNKTVTDTDNLSSYK